jgi:NAD(P)-dependent dehydrogenase (short-subunit alcohol dehydrogenase family)
MGKPIETWRWIYEVNVFGTVHCILAFLPAMMESQRPGRIVATASELGLMSDTDGATYASTKHAVVRIMEGLHLQLLEARSLVRATLLCPGVTSTNLLLSERHRPARWREPGRNSEPAAEERDAVGDLKPVFLPGSAPPERVASALLEALDQDLFYSVTAPEVDLR